MMITGAEMFLFIMGMVVGCLGTIVALLFLGE
jgi:hypothetical protein